MAPRVVLKTDLRLKSNLRFELAGEFCLNMGMTDTIQARNVQQGVIEGIISAIVVTGYDAKGVPPLRYTLRFDPLTHDTKVQVDLSDGNSTTEAVDGGLAVALSEAVQTMRRMKLTPKFNYEWSDRAKANPVILDEACARLGFIKNTGPLDPIAPEPPPQPAPTPRVSSPTITDEQWQRYKKLLDESPYQRPPSSTPSASSYQRASPPPAPTGYTYTEVMRVNPEKDNGVHLIAEVLKRTR